MNRSYQGYAEGLLTMVAGAALLATENFDLISRVIGLLAVVLGLVYSTTRFLWEIEDRSEKKRVKVLPGVPRIFSPEAVDPH